MGQTEDIGKVVASAEFWYPVSAMRQPMPILERALDVSEQRLSYIAVSFPSLKKFFLERHVSAFLPVEQAKIPGQRIPSSSVTTAQIVNAKRSLYRRQQSQRQRSIDLFQSIVSFLRHLVVSVVLEITGESRIQLRIQQSHGFHGDLIVFCDILEFGIACGKGNPPIHPTIP